MGTFLNIKPGQYRLEINVVCVLPQPPTTTSSLPPSSHNLTLSSLLHNLTLAPL